jgi:hypothetical protein
MPMVFVDATGRQVTRTAETEASYRRRYHQLAKRARIDPGNLKAMVKWFLAQDNQWVRSTISQYCAAIRQALIDAGDSDEVRYQLARLAKERPAPREDGQKCTSACKRKSIPHAEFAALITHLISGRHPDNRLAARFLAHNVLLFLRPAEWPSASVSGNILVIKNAKSTNGRSIGTERRRDLSDYSPNGVADLIHLLRTLPKTAVGAGGFHRLWERLNSRIARACKKIRIRRVALYSTRQQGMANAKSWMSPAEIAASAGHKTTVTATSHYAKSRSSWHPDKVKCVARPIPEDVAKVFNSPKASRAENYSERAKRRERDSQSNARKGDDPPFAREQIVEAMNEATIWAPNM